MSNVPFGGPPQGLANRGFNPTQKNPSSQFNRPSNPTEPRRTPPHIPAASRERIPPIAVPKKPPVPTVKKLTRPAPPPVSVKAPSKFRDFLLSFIISLSIFGITAFFICRILIDMFM